MTHRYVWSAAAGAGTGVDWTNAYTTVKAAAEAAGTAAGDNIWIAHDHAETGAVALTITTKNTQASPGTFMCANRAGSVPPVHADLRTTATVTTTGNSALSLLGVSGGMNHWYGIIFQVGTGAVAATWTVGAVNVGHWLKNCRLRKLGTATSVLLDFSGTIRLENTTLQFGSTGDGIRLIGGRFEWIDTPSAIEGSTLPLLLSPTPTASTEVVFRGVDLSALTGTLFASMAASQARDHRVINCKLNTVATVTASQGSVGGGRVTLLDSDSAATNYRHEYYRHAGTQLVETVIFRNGGATDGTTPIAWKIVTTADTRWFNPFESLPIVIWSNTTGVRTVDVYGYWDTGAVPNNDDIWIECSYLGSAGSPLGSTASSGKTSYLAAATPVTLDTTSTWGGGDTTTRFKLTVTPTTALRGILSVTVKVGRANATFYIDPKVVVT